MQSCIIIDGLQHHKLYVFIESSNKHPRRSHRKDMVVKYVLIVLCLVISSMDGFRVVKMSEIARTTDLIITCTGESHPLGPHSISLSPDPRPSDLSPHDLTYLDNLCQT